MCHRTPTIRSVFVCSPSWTQRALEPIFLRGVSTGHPCAVHRPGHYTLGEINFYHNDSSRSEDISPAACQMRVRSCPAWAIGTLPIVVRIAEDVRMYRANPYKQPGLFQWIPSVGSPCWTLWTFEAIPIAWMPSCCPCTVHGP